MHLSRGSLHSRSGLLESFLGLLLRCDCLVKHSLRLGAVELRLLILGVGGALLDLRGREFFEALLLSRPSCCSGPRSWSSASRRSSNCSRVMSGVDCLRSLTATQNNFQNSLAASLGPLKLVSQMAGCFCWSRKCSMPAAPSGGSAAGAAGGLTAHGGTEGHCLAFVSGLRPVPCPHFPISKAE